MKHKILLVLLFKLYGLYYGHCSKGFNGFPDR